MKHFALGLMTLTMAFGAVAHDHQPVVTDHQHTSERVWLTIGADASRLLEQEQLLDVKSVGFLNQTNEHVATISIPRAQITQLSQLMHDKFNRCGGFIEHANLSDADQFMLTVAEPIQQLFVPYSINNMMVAQQLISEVTQSRLTTTVNHLMTYHNRFHASQSGYDAAVWLQQRWSEISATRNDIDVSLFQHADPQIHGQPSVVLTIEGTSNSDEIVIIGGHLDSINIWDRQSGKAPGADDNASGIAVLTEALQVMVNKGFKPEKTIKIMGYAAEEVGLKGSNEIAQQYRSQGKNVIGVVQFDMTGHKGSDADIVFMTDFVSNSQNDFLVQLIDTYLPDVSYDFDKCGYACSDHASWTAQGYPASMPFESRMRDINSRIHTTQDTYFDQTQGRKFSQLAVAFLAELAKGELVDDSTPEPIGDKLQNNQPKNLNLAAKSYQHFTFDVPHNAISMKVAIEGDNGDADIYVNHNEKASKRHFVCKGVSNTSNEVCELFQSDGMQSGTYHIALHGYKAVRDLKLTASYQLENAPLPEPGISNLENGVVKKGITADQGEFIYFAFTVPAGADNVVISSKSGTGDADMHIKFGEKPTKDNYDCRPYQYGNEESCELQTRVGTYYVGLRAYKAFSGVELLASYTANGDISSVEENVTVPLNQWTHRVQHLNSAYQSLSVSISGNQGDVDLYLRHGSQSSESEFDCRPFLEGSEEVCTIDNPAQGDWYIDLYGYGRTNVDDITLSIVAVK